jgi:hypothetical protein
MYAARPMLLILLEGPSLAWLFAPGRSLLDATPFVDVMSLAPGRDGTLAGIAGLDLRGFLGESRPCIIALTSEAVMGRSTPIPQLCDSTTHAAIQYIHPPSVGPTHGLMHRLLPRRNACMGLNARVRCRDARPRVVYAAAPCRPVVVVIHLRSDGVGAAGDVLPGALFSSPHGGGGKPQAWRGWVVVVLYVVVAACGRWARWAAGPLWCF